MKRSSNSLIRVNSCLFVVGVIGFILPLAFSVHTFGAQQAWVAKYSNGSNTISQAFAIALDKEGNVYVAGHSTGTNAPFDYDYVVIKYNSLGVQQWVSRHGAAGTNDQVRAMVASTNGEVFVTGTSKTVKYLPTGLVAWSAPYGGHDITIDSNENTYVTGFLANDFSTVKIDAWGSNVWLRTWDYLGYQDFSQRLAVNSKGDVFVGGLATWDCFRGGCYIEPHVIKYDFQGNFQWDHVYNHGAFSTLSEFKELACDESGDLYAAANLQAGCCTWTLKRISSQTGDRIWSRAFDLRFAGDGVMALTLDGETNVYTTGGLDTGFLPTRKLRSDSTNIWEAYYGGSVGGSSRGHAVTVDTGGSAYVTGLSTGAGTGHDYVTIKYGTNGQQLWVQRYTEAGNSDDQAHAIAVAPNGDVYVTGFSNPSPGTYEITTIKYIQVAPIEKKSNGNIVLSLSGAPGSNYVIEAGTTLTNWSEIGSAIANTSGLYTFEDTNAPAFEQRFYRTKPE